MRQLVVLACLLAGCLAEKPHPCGTPPLMTGAITVSTQKENLWSYSRYIYDALGQRIRLFEVGKINNESFTYDVLLLYRESAMYEISYKNHTCKKRPLKADFHPMAIPKDAQLLGQAILGSSSGPGQGLLVNTWMGDLPDKSGKYVSTVTEFGCIPIGTSYQTKEYGWMLVSYFNNVIGIEDPSLLNPPDFCPDTETKATGEQVDFLSLFLNKD